MSTENATTLGELLRRKIYGYENKQTDGTPHRQLTQTASFIDVADTISKYLKVGVAYATDYPGILQRYVIHIPVQMWVVAKVVENILTVIGNGCSVPTISENCPSSPEGASDPGEVCTDPNVISYSINTVDGYTINIDLLNNEEQYGFDMLSTSIRILVKLDKQN